MPFAPPLCRRPLIPVTPMAAAFQPAIHAQLHWPGYGELARCQDSPHPALHQPQHQRRSQRLAPLLCRSIPATVVAAAADTTDTTITTQHPRQLRFPLQPQHLRRPQQPTAARRPRVAIQTLISRTAISLRLPCLRAILGTQAIQQHINRQQQISS